MPKIYLFMDGEQKGPYSEEQIGDLMSADKVTAETLYWKEGMTAWLAIGTLEAFRKVGHAGLRTIAPPRRTQQTESVWADVSTNPKGKDLKERDLSARTKPITVFKAVAMFVLLFLILSALLVLAGHWTPDAHQQFEDSASAALRNK